MSDLRTMNDPRELTFAQNFYKPMIHRWCNFRFNGAARENAASYIDARLTTDINDFTFFSASFCPDRDSQHLWNNYADNGRGASIGFRPEILFSLGQPLEVKYLDTSKNNVAEQFIQQFDWQYKQEIDLTIAIKGFPIPITALSTAMRAIYVGTKEAAQWSEEKEVRVTWVQDKHPTDEILQNPYWPSGNRRHLPVHNRNGKNGPVDYIVRSFAPDVISANPRNHLYEIILGSQCPLSVDEVKASVFELNYPPIPVSRQGEQ